MKHWQWLSVALLLLLLAVALVGVRSFRGSGGIAQAAAPQLVLDLVEDTGWCDTINATATVATGSPHQAAICLTGATLAPYSFDIIVDFSTAGLNSCLSESCGGSGNDPSCVNANPDFIGTDDTGPISTYDCTGGSGPANPPTCGDTAGEAFITCLASGNPGGLTGNWVIAVIEWTASGAGDDVLTFGDVAMADYDGLDIVACPGANCIGATVTKTGATAVPTSTPTSTMTPAATATRCPNDICPTSTPTVRAWTKTPTPTLTGTPVPSEPGEPAPPPPPPPIGGQLPEVVPPGTGTGSGGVAWTTSLMWTLAGAGVFSVLLGGLCFRRARNR